LICCSGEKSISSTRTVNLWLFYDTLLKEIPRGTIRSLVKTSLMEQFALMTRKFRERAKKGGKVGAGGSKSLIRIAIKHPVLVLRGMIKSI
jgi:hypothetical protein